MLVNKTIQHGNGGLKKRIRDATSHACPLHASPIGLTRWNSSDPCEQDLAYTRRREREAIWLTNDRIMQSVDFTPSLHYRGGLAGVIPPWQTEPSRRWSSCDNPG
jgi:hypothetical protein